MMVGSNAILILCTLAPWVASFPLIPSLNTHPDKQSYLLNMKNEGFTIESFQDLQLYSKYVATYPKKYAQGALNYLKNTNTKLANVDYNMVNDVLNQDVPFWQSKVRFQHQIFANKTFFDSVLAHTSAANGQSTSVYFGTGNMSNAQITPAAANREQLVEFPGYYSGTLRFGTHAKPMKMNFDTGSADAWILGLAPGVPVDQAYIPQLSKNSHDLGKQYTVGYFDGSGVAMEEWTDRVSFGGMSGENFQFGVAFAISKDSWKNGGVLGLAFPEVSLSNGVPLPRLLYRQRKVASETFAIDLTGGWIEIGSYDNSRPFFWSKIPVQSYWFAYQFHIEWSGKNILPRQVAIIDTGASGIVVPYEHAHAMFQKIPFATPIVDNMNVFYMMECSQLKQFVVSFDHVSVRMPFNDMVLSKHGPLCTAAIYGQMGIQDIIVGDIYLRHIYAAFDYTNNQVGLRLRN